MRTFGNGSRSGLTDAGHVEHSVVVVLVVLVVLVVVVLLLVLMSLALSLSLSLSLLLSLLVPFLFFVTETGAESAVEGRQPTSLVLKASDIIGVSMMDPAAGGGGGEDDERWSSPPLFPLLPPSP